MSDLYSVGVVVGTYGDDDWSQRGQATADQLRAAFPEVHVISSHDHTLAKARNTGAKVLSLDIQPWWLCFVDADDELEAGYFDAMRRRIMERSYLVAEWSALLVPAVRYVNQDGTETPVCIPNGTPRRPLYEINRACIGSLVEAHVFDRLGGFHELAMYEDWQLWLRACERGVPLLDVPDAVYRAHVHPVSRNQLSENAVSIYWQQRNYYERRAANVKARW